ncbi:hypothetical protein A3Q56_01124 [Intoshia linei]|uniref:Acyl-CoA dehydrogenase family member 9, mitochondrial n=1 Tax=Intoshia linei TaxID=1819745 RepID=A0A177B9V1_9BILA|nr:hypothetical protein A3Q56_01124 [Intoshia linei]
MLFKSLLSRSRRYKFSLWNRINIKNRNTSQHLQKLDPVKEITKESLKLDHESIQNLGKKIMSKHKPFLSDLVAGKFDKNMLIYPEISNKHDYENLIKYLTELESVAVDLKSDFFFNSEFEKFGIYEIGIPQFMGGNDFSKSKTVAIFETLSIKPTFAAELLVNNIISTGIIAKYASDEMARRVFEKKCQISYCLAEELGTSDVKNMKCTASRKDNKFTLNGKKCLVMNAKDAKYFIVFAQQNVPSVDDAFGAFLVKNENLEIELMPGYGNHKLYSVKFDNTLADSILSHTKSAYHIIMKTFHNSRLYSAAIVSGILKNAINYLAEYGSQKIVHNERLMEGELAKLTMFKLVKTSYALESMIYLISNVQDMYDEPNVDAEACVLKNFAHKESIDVLIECQRFMGSIAYGSNSFIQKCIDDVNYICSIESSYIPIEQFVGFNGFFNLAKNKSTQVKNALNTFKTAKNFIQHIKNTIFENSKSPSLDMNLYDYIHHNFCSEAEQIEKSLKSFFDCIDIILMFQSDELDKSQFLLFKVSNILTNFLSTISILSRASRSICIGLRDCDYEIGLSKMMINENLKNIDNDIEYIRSDNFKIDKRKMAMIGYEVYKNQKLVHTHALTRNW